MSTTINLIGFAGANLAEHPRHHALEGVAQAVCRRVRPPLIERARHLRPHGGEVAAQEQLTDARVRVSGAVLRVERRAHHEVA